MKLIIVKVNDTIFKNKVQAEKYAKEISERLKLRVEVKSV